MDPTEEIVLEYQDLHQDSPGIRYGNQVDNVEEVGHLRYIIVVNGLRQIQMDPRMQCFLEDLEYQGFYVIDQHNHDL